MLVAAMMAMKKRHMTDSAALCEELAQLPQSRSRELSKNINKCLKNCLSKGKFLKTMSSLRPCQRFKARVRIHQKWMISSGSVITGEELLNSQRLGPISHSCSRTELILMISSRVCLGTATLWLR